MSDPVVTESMLERALANHPTKEDLANALANHPTKEDLANALANYPTKEDLANALANYATKEDLANAFANYPTREEVKQIVEDAFQRFANVMTENFERYFGALDDKYRDLPDDHASLRGEVEAHVADATVHVRPKRPRRRAR